MPDDMKTPVLHRPKLVLHVDGAREEELARGLAAAEAVLYRDGDIDIYVAMAADEARDFVMYDENWEPINDLSKEERRLAKLWDDALAAGLDACCAGWDKRPARGRWLGIDDGAETITPWYKKPPIETFKLGEE